MHVLVAVKDSITRMVTIQELDFFNYDVIVENTLDNIVKIIEKEDIGVLIVDMALIENTNDPEYVQKICDKGSEAKRCNVIFIGDDDNEFHRKFAYEHNAVGFVDRQLIREDIIFHVDGIIRPDTMFQGFRAVVVDDTEDALDIVAESLEECGVKVYKFNNAFDAYEKIKEVSHKLDLIITDQKMDGMTGVDLCGKVKVELGLKSTPIIFITGYSDKENIIALYDAGASDHLLKPYHQEELWSKVRGHLQRQQFIRHLERGIVERAQLDSLKSEFLAISSYDLKTPVGLIKGYSEILEDCIEGEDKSYVEKISKSSFELEKQIDELQGLTRFLNIGTDRENMDMVDMEIIVKESVSTLSLIADRKGVSVSVSKDIFSGNTLIPGNDAALTKALNNLINVMITYTDSGESIKIQLGKEECGCVNIRLEAPGNNLPDNVITNLHSRMWRGVQVREKESIGLHITKSVVEFHKGVFMLQREGDNLAVANITIPIS